jgi:hypothetical protein
VVHWSQKKSDTVTGVLSVNAFSSHLLTTIDHV